MQTVRWMAFQLHLYRSHHMVDNIADYSYFAYIVPYNAYHEAVGGQVQYTTKVIRKPLLIICCYKY